MRSCRQSEVVHSPVRVVPLFFIIDREYLVIDSMFVSLDVETASADLTSICQLGVVTFKDGLIVDSWNTLVNPECEFDEFNIEIHGIMKCDVIKSPKFPIVAPELDRLISDQIVVAHTGFDKAALTRTYTKYGMSIPECHWLDSAGVCRRAWNQFARRGYGLANVAEWCGVEFRHHDASEDARAAGLILLKAINDTGVSLNEWLVRVKKPINLKAREAFREVRAKSNGRMYGEKIVFTGALSISRREATSLAVALGCDVGNTVGNDTTIVVVGSHHTEAFTGGQSKSRQHQKAKFLVRTGHPIRIISEKDFKEMVQ